MWKPQTVLLSALSHVESQHFNPSRHSLYPRRWQKDRRPVSLRVWGDCAAHDGLLLRFKALPRISKLTCWACSVLGGVRGAREESGVRLHSSWLHSVVTHNGAPPATPMGFHFKSLAFVQKCICSLILFGNYVKQKRMNGEKNHSFSLPTLQPHPTTTSLSLSLFPTLSLPLSPSLVVHILLQMLMISPSVFWCKVCLHFPFHPHTNVLLLPLRPRAFLVAFLKYAVW